MLFMKKLVGQHNKNHGGFWARGIFNWNSFYFYKKYLTKQNRSYFLFKEKPILCTIYLQYISSNTSTCFGRIYSPSSGGTPYGHNNKYQLFYPYGVPPDDLLQIGPKHTEVFEEMHRKIVHQVGFSLNEYIEIHGQNNIKFRNYFLAVCSLITT